MIVNFRRLAGLTSLDSKRWRSHLSASGPAGVLESSVMAYLVRSTQSGMMAKPTPIRIARIVPARTIRRV